MKGLVAIMLALIASAGCHKDARDEPNDRPAAERDGRGDEARSAPNRGRDGGGEDMDDADARAVVERWMAAGAARDAEAVGAAVDWGATGAVSMTSGMRDLAELGNEVEPAARRGVSALVAGEDDPQSVVSRVADLMATLSEEPTKLRPIEGADREELMGRLDVRPPEGVPAEVLEELEPRLARARGVEKLFAVESARGHIVRVGVSAEGRLVLIPGD